MIVYFVFASAIMTSTECLLFQCFCSMHFLPSLIMYNIPYICHFSAKGKRKQETPSSCKCWNCFEIFNYKKCKWQRTLKFPSTKKFFLLTFIFLFPARNWPKRVIFEQCAIGRVTIAKCTLSSDVNMWVLILHTRSSL